MVFDAEDRRVIAKIIIIFTFANMTVTGAAFAVGLAWRVFEAAHGL